jgi:excinuclease ABC subunit B
LGNVDFEEAKNTLNPEQLSNLLIELKAEMENAAKQLDFERAARLRDQIFHLEQLL